MRWRLLSLLLVTLLPGLNHASPQSPEQQEPQEEVLAEQILVGHWILAKGEYLGSGDFQADEIELLEPTSSETLVGHVDRVFPNQERFWVNGQVVRGSSKMNWGGLSIHEIEGKLVKVKGHYRGPLNFSARSISLRQKGRSSVEGRVDHIRETERGREAIVLNVRVLLPSDVDVIAEIPIEGLELAPLEHSTASPDRLYQEQLEDAIPGTVHLTDTLRFGAILETNSTIEDNYNLNDKKPRNRTEHQPSLTAELRWQPTPKMSGLLRGRGSYRYRTEQSRPDRELDDARLSEAWLNWIDLFGVGIELQVGRQDFDDPREWVYDQNLDAVRTVWNHESVRLELSASTNLTNGTEFDRHSNNYIAYLSNNNRKKHLGAYIVDRRDARVPRSYPIHFGVRALGDWIPQSESWLEYSVLRGYTEDMNLESWAFDVGSTWSPPSLEPFYLSAGFAYSTGDDPSTPEVNEGFQQTGFQDNNGRLGGVTSFRYYGELVDPELSNLGILTLGLGMRPTRDSSLDLVYHDYRLSELTTKMRDTQLKNQPNGVGQGYGEELDLILGVRRLQGFDIKFVLGYFRPGDAFTGGDDAFLASFRLRYRF